MPSLRPSPPVDARTCVVERGDTLWGLARRYRGDPRKWPLLYEVNRPRIANPDLILPGQRILVAPALGDR